MGRKEEQNTQIKMCDENYIEVYGLKLLTGEGLVKSDTANRVVINESFSKGMGYEDPNDAVGEIISIWDLDLPVSGVVADFHTTSFQHKIEPVVLYLDPSRYEMAAISLHGKNIPGTMQMIEEVFTDLVFCQ